MARQGVAVRAQARRVQTEQHVARLDSGWTELGALRDDADREAGHVEVACSHQSAVLGDLAAEQGATRLATPLGDAGDDRFDMGRVDRLDRHVVEHEQGRGTHADEVIDAHGHEVDSD